MLMEWRIRKGNTFFIYVKFGFLIINFKYLISLCLPLMTKYKFRVVSDRGENVTVI